jgi:hypothetical protein
MPDFLQGESGCLGALRGLATGARRYVEFRPEIEGMVIETTSILYIRYDSQSTKPGRTAANAFDPTLGYCICTDKGKYIPVLRLFDGEAYYYDLQPQKLSIRGRIGKALFGRLQRICILSVQTLSRNIVLPCQDDIVLDSEEGRARLAWKLYRDVAPAELKGYMSVAMNEAFSDGDLVTRPADTLKSLVSACDTLQRARLLPAGYGGA